MKYNPFAYIHSEKDILKLVTTLIANTTGNAKSGDDFWVKAETLLYTALIGYIYHNGNSTSTTLKCYVAPEDKRRISAKTVKNVPYQMNIINENGLQSVVTACTLPRAPQVRRWLSGEVLPVRCYSP